MSVNSFYTDPSMELDPLREVQSLRLRIEEAHKDKKELEVEFLNLKRNFLKVTQELKLAREDPNSGAVPEAMRQRFMKLEMQHEELLKSKEKQFNDLYAQVIAKEAGLQRELVVYED